MRGYGSLFLAICMSLIAASAAAVLHLVLELPLIEALLIGLVLLFAMLALEISSARRRDRAEFADRFEGIARATADIAREVGEIHHRVVALEKKPDVDPAAWTQPLATELNALAVVVEDLAHSVAVHEATFAQRQEQSPEPAAKGAFATSPGQPAQQAPVPGKSEEELKALVRQAVDDGRIELYLQPVVTLPQRKVRYYEALSRMRLLDGGVIEAARFLPVARSAGLLPKIDEKLVHGCVQIVRRLAAKNHDKNQDKNRGIGLFLNIAPETLVDRAAYSEILGYLEANRALAPSLVLELPQSAYRQLGPAELLSMSMLAERGFRFSLDRIQDFRFDPRGLHERGIRFLKVPAELMLSGEAVANGHIHPADLTDLLARHGIELVAERIESESVVVDLLELDVRFGQGYLFAQPRPVRAEALGIERAPEVALARPAGQSVARTA